MSEESSTGTLTVKTEEPPAKKARIETTSEKTETRDNHALDKSQDHKDLNDANEAGDKVEEKVPEENNKSALQEESDGDTSKLKNERENEEPVPETSTSAQSEEVKSRISDAVAHAKAAISATMPGISGINASSESPLKVPTATEIPPESEKPARGSPAWQQMRKLNHKEVERRRRESINQAIKELRELLPTQNSNKSQTIKRAAEYIRRLRENENANIEKWTLEKLITDQAVNELANSNEKLKSELEKAYREIELWKKHLFEAKDTIEKLKGGKN